MFGRVGGGGPDGGVAAFVLGLDFGAAADAEEVAVFARRAVRWPVAREVAGVAVALVAEAVLVDVDYEAAVFRLEVRQRHRRGARGARATGEVDFAGVPENEKGLEVRLTLAAAERAAERRVDAVGEDLE